MVLHNTLRHRVRQVMRKWRSSPLVELSSACEGASGEGEGEGEGERGGGGCAGS